MRTQTTSDESMAQAFRLAVERMSGQARMAALIGRTQGAISKRLAQRKPIWPEKVLEVEAATGISRHELRPDFYPIENSESSAVGVDTAPAVNTNAAGAEHADPAQAAAPGGACTVPPLGASSIESPRT